DLNDESATARRRSAEADIHGTVAYRQSLDIGTAVLQRFAGSVGFAETEILSDAGYLRQGLGKRLACFPLAESAVFPGDPVYRVAGLLKFIPPATRPMRTDRVKPALIESSSFGIRFIAPLFRKVEWFVGDQPRSRGIPALYPEPPRFAVLVADEQASPVRSAGCSA